MVVILILIFFGALFRRRGNSWPKTLLKTAGVYAIYLVVIYGAVLGEILFASNRPAPAESLISDNLNTPTMTTEPIIDPTPDVTDALATVALAPGSKSRPWSFSHADEGTCVTGAIYATGTRLVAGPNGEASKLLLPDGRSWRLVPPYSLLRTTGPYVEAGACDLWPVEVVQVPLILDPVYVEWWDSSVPSDLLVKTRAQGFIDERSVRPER